MKKRHRKREMIRFFMNTLYLIIAGYFGKLLSVPSNSQSNIRILISIYTTMHEEQSSCLI